MAEAKARGKGYTKPEKIGDPLAVNVNHLKALLKLVAARVELAPSTARDTEDSTKTALSSVDVTLVSKSDAELADLQRQCSNHLTSEHAKSKELLQVEETTLRGNQSVSVHDLTAQLLRIEGKRKALDTELAAAMAANTERFNAIGEAKKTKLKEKREKKTKKQAMAAAAAAAMAREGEGLESGDEVSVFGIVGVISACKGKAPPMAEPPTPRTVVKPSEPKYGTEQWLTAQLENFREIAKAKRLKRSRQELVPSWQELVPSTPTRATTVPPTERSSAPTQRPPQPKAQGANFDLSAFV